MNTTKYPATVRELADMAAEKGIKPSELLATLLPSFTMPAAAVNKAVTK